MSVSVCMRWCNACKADTEHKVGELLVKALLSSGAMYGGFVTLDQRKQLMEMAQEVERGKLVATLRETINEKEQLMSVSSCIFPVTACMPHLHIQPRVY